MPPTNRKANPTVTVPASAPVESDFDAIELLGAPEFSFKVEGDRVTIRPLHISVRDAGFGKFLTLHGVDPKTGELLALKVVGHVLTERFKELADGNPTNLIGRDFTVAYTGDKKSNKRTDKDGDPVSYHNYIVVEGDGSDLAAAGAADLEGFDW